MTKDNLSCRPSTTDAMQRLADENEALRAENGRLKGVTPDMPPLPPEGYGLPRYGLRWNGPKEPLTVLMDDGYWTPWHLADALRADRDELAARVARLSEKAHQLSYDLVHSLHDDFPKDCDSSFGLLQDAIAETPAKSVAHIRAAGAREALERAMKVPGFSDTVVRVDLMREIIEKMEAGK